MAYVRQYREGMGQDYTTTLREALAASRQQAGLSGQQLTPQQQAGIAQGVLAPYLGVYGTGLQGAYERDVELARMEEEYDLAKMEQKQAEKTAETAAVSQFGSLALLGGHLYGPEGGAGTTAAGGGAASYGGAFAESAPAASGGGAAGTGTASGGAATWGNAFAFVGGGMVGYGVSPYGQQLEEGIGRPGSIAMALPFGAPAPGGHHKKGGERLGMMAIGAGGGYLATGGNPIGAAGGALGGFLQENPETGKRGYQEIYSWYLKPAVKGTAHDIKQVGRIAGNVFTDPGRVARKISLRGAQKAYKKVKKLF